MRATIAKRIMKEVRAESAQEVKQGEVKERELVQDARGQILNNPDTIRAFYLAMKRAFVRISAGMGAIWDYNVARRHGLIKPQPQPRRGAGGKAVPQRPDRIAIITNPLALILRKCPGSQTPTGGYEPHPTFVKARRLADRGDGAAVQKMARQFLPA